jgi:putative endonuclease
MTERHEFGKKGEQLAEDFLMENGYGILEKNYRFRKAELDIIALKGTLLVIVEVKSRASDAIMDPKEAITPKKMKLLITAANEYVTANGLEVEVRFDIIAVLKEKDTYRIEHIENAFYPF